MNKHILSSVLLLGFSILTTSYASDNLIEVDLNQKGADVSGSMYGVFFEEINHAGNGGLYAELVQNRGFDEKELLAGYTVQNGNLIPRPEFEHLSQKVRTDKRYRWNPQEIPGWTLKDPKNAAMVVLKGKPLFEETPAYLQVKVSTAPAHLLNSGYWGMGIKEGEHYKLRFYLRAEKDYSGNAVVKLLSQDDKELSSQSFTLKTGNQWEEYTATLTATKTDAKAKLLIELNQTGTVSIDYVSLFPEKTFNNRPNGLRNDVAKMLQDLHPAFVRWPGGCVVEGITLDNRHEWKKSLGDPARRTGQYSTWGYRDTYGFGYHEFLQFCEDIGANGMFVCNVGLGCQYRVGDASDESEISFYVNDVLDAIEYAIGGTTTEWGAKRAAAGHPEPFPLKYIEIGNENWGKEYNKRFDIFYKAIKEKYPQLALISNHGLQIKKGEIAKTDMIDPHWYVDPNFFFNNANIFDKQPRGDYKVYVGEYAVNRNVGGGNMLAALSEAAFISGMERNSDLVKMCSFAPLLENRNDREWAVNLIWIDTDSVVGRSSYYVQKMYAENKPTYNLKTNIEHDEPINFGAGMIGLGTYLTQAEFKDITITTSGNKQTDVKQSDWEAGLGTWKNENGVLTQTSNERMTLNILKSFKGEAYTLNLKAKKLSGEEGFFVYFGESDNKKNGYMVNIAGWGNTKTAVQKIIDGQATLTDIGIPHKVETGKWYGLKLVVNPSNVELFVDGVSVYRYENKKTSRHYAVAGYDEQNRELVLKVVNAENEPYTAGINLKGTNDISANGRVITLSAENVTDENSFDNPKKIVPKESTFQTFGKKFDYVFPANSFTILRIKAKK